MVPDHENDNKLNSMIPYAVYGIRKVFLQLDVTEHSICKSTVPCSIQGVTCCSGDLTRNSSAVAGVQDSGPAEKFHTGPGNLFYYAMANH